MTKQFLASIPLLLIPSLLVAQGNYVANSTSSPSPGAYNTLVGYQAGFSNTTGSFNVYSGLGAGYNNVNGSRNV